MTEPPTTPMLLFGATLVGVLPVLTIYVLFQIVATLGAMVTG